MKEFELMPLGNTNGASNVEDADLTLFNPEAELPFHEDDIENSDEMRIHDALALGLTADATWEDVNEARDKAYLSKLAIALGLPEDASHDAIIEERTRRGIGHMAYAMSLGLSADASPDQVEEADREAQRRNRVRLHEVAEAMRANRARNVTPKAPQSALE